MPIERIEPIIEPVPSAARRRVRPRTDTPREGGTRPVVAVIRSLLMLALAGLAILGLLPAVVAAQAAATL